MRASVKVSQLLFQRALFIFFHYNPMQKLFLFGVILLFSFSDSFSQGIVRGKITDSNGESLIGVNIYLKANRSIGTTTDLDGNYSLKIADSNANVLVISYISFQTIEEAVHPKKGEV